MSARKRNEWLDTLDSEDDDRGYDSEDQGRARILGGSKRVKLDQEHSEEDKHSSIESEEEFEQDEQDSRHHSGSRTTKSTSQNSTSELRSDRKSKELAELKKPLDGNSKKNKSGVIYISRVPLFMKPSVLRSLLAPYGEIGRIFLTPEDSTSRTRRLKSGGTRRKLYLDGWVEFLSKKDARFVAENLNAQTIGGKKRSRFHDEVWNVKYLRGLKWHHLVEQIANENAERAARMRAEISQSNRENRMFLENVERAKMLGGMEAKRKKRAFDENGEEAKGIGKEGVGGDRVEVEGKEIRRRFRQNEVKMKQSRKVDNGEEVQRVLSKIF
ncbi:hypothetical protein K469DRAFT_165997 [Zopfia rhizophila CBS 207.26]|uniref:18S rRNA factor 2 n=1 Tax=Zopfia rhizophila CBS 207.26 TaxID=1314779 RepID=A0A6A6E2T1_9PEZI|nr:hypothetical protein K469DRAFT_165997 [Zopfia rhizophila CBS 207.26]